MTNPKSVDACIRSGRKRVSATVPFSLRVRLGQYEVEVSGSKDDVLCTFEDLPGLIAVVSEAFSQASAETRLDKVVPQSASQSLVSQPLSSVAGASGYPSIQSSGGCADAVVRLLATDWGRVAPRTLPEIVEAMRVNAVHYPVTTLSGVLNWLVRKGKVKRWKTDKGYVYVLSQANTAPSQPSTQMQNEAVEASTEGE